MASWAHKILVIWQVLLLWLPLSPLFGCDSEEDRPVQPDPMDEMVELNLVDTPLRQAASMIELAVGQPLELGESLEETADCARLTLSTHGPARKRDIPHLLGPDLAHLGLTLSSTGEGLILEGEAACPARVASPPQREPEAPPVVHVTRNESGQYLLSPELADALARAPLAEVGGSTAAPETTDGELTAYVLFVSAGSLPARLGLRTGDRVVRIGRRAVSDPRSIRVLQGARRRGRLSITVVRGGQERTLSYRLGPSRTD